MEFKFILKCRRWFLDSNLWLASCAMALTLYLGQALQQKYWLAPSFWVGAYITSVYNLHGLSSLRRKQLFDLNAARYYRSRLALMITFVSTGCALLLLLLAPSELWLPGWMAVMLSLFYGNSFQVKKIKMSAMRELPYLKGFVSIIALILVIAMLPCFWEHVEFNAQCVDVLALLTVHLWINTTVGDLRDYRLDSQKGVKTLPVLLGFDRTKMFLICVSCVAGMMGLYLEYLPLGILFLADAGVLLCINGNSAKKYYHWVDVVHWVPLVLTFCSRRF